MEVTDTAPLIISNNQNHNYTHESRSEYHSDKKLDLHSKVDHIKAVVFYAKKKKSSSMSKGTSRWLCHHELIVSLFKMD